MRFDLTLDLETGAECVVMILWLRQMIFRKASKHDFHLHLRLLPSENIFPEKLNMCIMNLQVIVWITWCMKI